MSYYIEESAEFAGDAGSILGDAVYTVETDTDYSSDIGGVDGPVVTSVELLHVRLDALILSRSQVALVCGASGVERGEAAALEELSQNFGLIDFTPLAAFAAE